MSWRFWAPRHTFRSVAGRLVRGLRDGSVVLDEPFADDLDEAQDTGLILHLDIPAASSDAEVLETVKVLAHAADEGHRHGGGHGLCLHLVKVISVADAHRPGGRALHVNLRPKVRADRPELLRDVLAILRQRSDLPLLADTEA